MDRKQQEDQFFNDMDDYLNRDKHSNPIASDEYKEMLKLGEQLANQDFSQHSDKEAVLRQSLRRMEPNKGGYNMRKSNKIKKFTLIAASISILFFGTITLVQPSFAETIVNRIIQTFSAGQLRGTQSESPEMIAVPEELKGKLYDKDGHIIEVLTNNQHEMYTADGKRIAGISEDNEIITESEKAKLNREDDQYFVVTDSGELNKYAGFDVILPSYLPEGYTFDQAKFITDEQGNVIDQYLFISFTNKHSGKSFTISKMLGIKENAYEIGTFEEMEQVQVNGIDAILTGGRNLDWEYNHVFYGIHGKEAISTSEIIKIAESIR